MARLSSKGIFKYSNGSDGHKLNVIVCPNLVNFYRSLVPKSIRLNRQKFAPHITVLRQEIPKDLSKWKAFQSQGVSFGYDPYIYNDDTYWWLNVYSSLLESIRKDLGLDYMSPYTRPPNGWDCFHITIGNTKETW